MVFDPEPDLLVFITSTASGVFQLWDSFLLLKDYEICSLFCFGRSWRASLEKKGHVHDYDYICLLLAFLPQMYESPLRSKGGLL